MYYAFVHDVESDIPSTPVMQGPEYILPNDIFELSCKGNHPVHAQVQNCLLLSKSSQRMNGEFRVNLHVQHVQKACKVTCFSGTKTTMKEIPVIGKQTSRVTMHVTLKLMWLLTDGIITPVPHSAEIFKGMPFTLTCKSRCSYRPDVYQVIWKTNNKSVFVENDKDHTVWSTPAFKDTQSHHLTVHAASRSADYQCLLIDVHNRNISGAELHVNVKESGS